jgi:hypothetical protein
VKLETLRRFIARQRIASGEKPLLPNAYVLLHRAGSEPRVAELSPERDWPLGDQQESELPLPGLCPCTISYHEQLKTWVLNVTDGRVTINDQEAEPGRVFALPGRCSLGEFGGVRLDFYSGRTLRDRLLKEGVTRRARRPRAAPAPSPAPARVGPPQAGTRRDTKIDFEGQVCTVSWG